MPGGWLVDTLALYDRVFRRGAALAARNWQVGLAVIVYTALVSVAAVVAAQLGFAGALLLGLVMTACASSWLSLTAQVIQTGRARLRDLPAGFGTYLGDLLMVGFLLTGLRLVASIVLAPFPLLNIVFGLATLAFFNAVPELIYLGRHAPAELLVASYRFVAENWIEWFPANVLLGALVGAALLVPAGPYGLVSALAVGVVLAYAMIVRGLLFQELASSGRRSREFKRRAAG